MQTRGKRIQGIGFTQPCKSARMHFPISLLPKEIFFRACQLSLSVPNKSQKNERAYFSISRGKGSFYCQMYLQIVWEVYLVLPVYMLLRGKYLFSNEKIFTGN